MNLHLTSAGGQDSARSGKSPGPLARVPASRQPLRGMALVVTLSLVVLLAFVLVALFSRATSTLAIERTSSGGVEALLLARSAASLIVSDLQAEMKASSIANGSAWLPGSGTNMLPVRQVLVSASDTNFLNLIKQSGVPMFANGFPAIAIAGGTSTAAAASDGHIVSAARWSTPMLTGANFSNAGTPHWIYVNRDATLSASPSTNAIGRFAFNVYDVGGLLDINAAGFSPKASGGDPDEVATKGGAVWADLRSIPGIISGAYAANASWPPKWRIGGDWTTFTSTNANSSLPWYHKVGWLQPYLNADGVSSDRMFSSRQDLIRYARANASTFSADANGLVTALQYLTTFSRDANQPSHKPPSDRPMVKFNESQGGNDAIGLDNAINPGARDATGRALVKKRFALGNISLLSDSTASAGRIEKLFGLTKSGNTWVYDHGDPDQILKLEDVPPNRDPDFFEMLKAAITAGSLGVQHGTSLPVSPVEFYRPSLGYDDAVLNYQIIQIAANIIDQADTDSYPTQIVFDGTTFAGVENLPFMDAISLQVLPEKVLPGVKPPDSPGHTYTYFGDWTGVFQAVALLRPRLWNPHSGNPTDAAKTPVNFRLRAETSASGAAHFVKARYINPLPAPAGAWPVLTSVYVTDYSVLDPLPPQGTGQGQNYGPGASDNPAHFLDAATSPSTALSIDFSLDSGWQSANTFLDPRILSHVYPGSGLSAISGTSGVTEFSTMSPWIKNGFADGQDYPIPSSAIAGLPSYNVCGFPLGRVWMGPYVSTGGSNLRLFSILRTLGGVVKITLECSNGSDWIPYDVAYYFPQDINATASTDQIYTLNPPGDTLMIRALDQQTGMTSFKFDARSKRWGSVVSYSGFLARGARAQAFSRWQNYTMRERETLRQGSTAPSSPFGRMYQPPGSRNHDPAAAQIWTVAANSDPGTSDIAGVAANTDASKYRYLDPDGIRRRGMAAYWIDGSFDGQPMANSADPSTGTARTEVPRNRPVILNRAFRSVAELGYVFRDTPWRNLDFFTVESGDAALLDFFCVHDTENATGRSLVPLTEEGAPVVAGKVNLNTRHPEVLAALIRGAARENQTSPSHPVSEADALAIGQGIVAFSATNAFTSLADLVGKPVDATAYAGFADKLGSLLSTSEDKAVKQRRETVLRAMADAGSVRTWNVLIDVVAQSGVASPDGEKFFPVGERRIWASTAIDRFTAKIIGRQWENLNE